ncbi:MAG: S16 family serine protease [Candidatus Zixiibacteriota bacterium]
MKSEADRNKGKRKSTWRSTAESTSERLLNELRSRVEAEEDLTKEVRDRCFMEIDRLEQLSDASVEYGATRQYIEWLLSIPWKIHSRKRTDLKRIERRIDQEYFGSQKIKRKILERIAIRKLTGNSSINSILCLAGVPGTGKASLAKAIAKAMGKEFIRVSVGGLTKVYDIKGTVRTYLGAMPGIIIRTLQSAGTSDPVVLIEDIENLGGNSGTVLAMSLLEAIDPRYNCRFLDNYIGFPIDLSNVFFICAVKSSEDIPEVFNHRFEVIELNGYIEKDKIHIALTYIIPSVLKKHGLQPKDIVFSDKGLQKIIRNYTLEAGLLNLKRQIEIICRHVAKEKASGVRKTWMVNEKTVGSFLGTPQYSLEKPGDTPEIGVAIGLAWTGQGGDLMIIEGLRMKGSGEVITTGSLGDVMKESIQAAHSYVRSKADVLGIDHNDFDNFDIHIHFPSGAIPKDGPSAGVAVSLVIASVMAERPIRNDIAMTGEVTLRGKVLQVGGLIEKVSAAYRAGIPTVFIPKENKKELKDLPQDILKKTKFVFIESVDDVFARGLLDFIPSSYTLEKLFAEEMRKAKNRKKTSGTRRIAAKSRKKK